MPAPTVTSVSTPRPRPPWWKYRWTALLGVVAVVIVVFAVSQLNMTSPATVSKVTFRNNSPYDLLVSVTGADHDGVTSLGTAVANTSTDIDEVIDQGDVWIFRFEGQGRDGGEVRVDRKQLAAEHWNLTIPDAVGARLRAGGAEPSPVVAH